jgi:hypothetical protein
MGSPKLRQGRVREAAVGYSTYEGAATGVVYGVSGSTSSATERLASPDMRVLLPAKSMASQEQV